MLGDPNALYCKSRGGGTTATLDQTGKPQYLRQRSCSQPTSVSLGGPAVSRKQGFDSDPQDSPAGPGSSRQVWQALQSVLALSSAAIRQEQKPTLRIQLMETKTQTIHTITTGRVEIGGGRIEATCQTSGDTVTLELPYGAVTEAVEKYLTDRMTRWDRDRIITMLTDLNREADAKAEASK